MDVTAPVPDRGRRLRGSDSGFLYVESESQTSAFVVSIVLDPPTDGRPPLTLDELTSHIEDRLDRLPHLRRRLVMVPGGIGHPVWADDPEFDLASHLSRATLGPAHLAAGSPDEQLTAWIPEISATRMPIDRPLWHLTLVDGFSDGRQVLALRVHHTLGDGGALRGLLSELFDDRSADAPPLTSSAERLPQRMPWRAWLFLTTFVAQCLTWLAAPVLVARTLRSVKAVKTRRAAAVTPVPAMAGSAPDTVLNRSADTRRQFARTVVELDDLKAVKQASGAPLSDVVVAVVAGALRAHLRERDALPEVPLVVNVPMGNDAPDAVGRVRGNDFVNFYAYLPTDVADPLARLAAVRLYHAEARHQLDLQGRDLIPAWLDRVPPAVAWKAAQKMARQHRDGESAPDYNVLVSNVPVPGDDWRTGGRPVQSIFMSGPVTDGFGLNITVTGFGDHVSFALHSNPASVPDPARLGQQIQASLDELIELCPIDGDRAGDRPDDSEVA